MMREFNRKIERIKNDIATLEEQIRIIDSKLQ
jgi:chaperonin cofactor prefoldin